MNGILLINKEKDYTSRDVVNVVGKHLNTKQVGHTGTLDPLATGVLVLCVGNATKLVDIITSDDKEYIAEAVLGMKTDTLDMTGKTLENKEAHFTKEQIEEALKSMIGLYEQEVPAYSAVKVEGKKLYEYARNNENIVLPKRQVEVKSIELYDEIRYCSGKTVFRFKTLVSKGTYIRSLIVDIANKLGTIGTMNNLIRTRQGKFKLEDCYTLDDIKNNNYKIISIKDVLSDVKQLIIAPDIEKIIMNGNVINNIYETDKVLFINDMGEEVALYHQVNDNLLKPWKVFNINK